MIIAKQLSFSYGYEPIFDTVSFSVVRGDKVGIVGRNGAGKSTLFKLLTRQEFPSDGTLSITGDVSMVPQEVKYDSALQTATSLYDYIDPTSIHPKNEIDSILNGLEFDWRSVADNQPLPTLSGGQKTKLALARAFLLRPKILLLDEPTNFLDEAGKKWVMHFLSTYPHTLLIVSHDLDLLDRHIKHVLFLNPDKHTIESYTGNYTSYLRQKREADALLVRQITNEQKHIKRMEQGVSNMRRFTSKRGVHQRVMLERRIERIKDKLPDAPTELKGFTAKFPDPLPIGQVPLRCRHISMSYGEHEILRDFSLDLMRSEHLALIGSNGVGKTTLIKILTGKLTPQSGQVIASDTLSLGVYAQESTTLDDSLTLFETVAAAHTLPTDKIYAFLMRFLFPPDRLNQHVGTLSGGEKTRLAIALLMTHPYNVLILDEPTTYLDVLSQRIILEALKSYKGTLLLVSHTEEFVSELKPDRALLLPEQKLQIWSSSLTDQVSLI